MEKFDFIPLMEEDCAVVKEDGARHLELDFLDKRRKRAGDKIGLY